MYKHIQYHIHIYGHVPSATKWRVKNYSLIPIKGWWYHYENGDLLVGGWTTHSKNMLVKLEIFPQTSGWKFPKYLSCHQPVYPSDSVSFFFGNGQPSLQVALKSFMFCFFACHHCCVQKCWGNQPKGSLKIAGIQNSFGNLLLKTCCDLSPKEKKHSWSSPQRSTRLCTLGCLRMRDLMLTNRTKSWSSKTHLTHHSWHLLI